MQVGCILPGLILATPDVGASAPQPDDQPVRCFAIASRLIKGFPCLAAAGPIKQMWQAKFRGELVSAI